jgi:hypothetical protein
LSGALNFFPSMVSSRLPGGLQPTIAITARPPASNTLGLCTIAIARF